MGYQFFLPMVLRWRASRAEAPLLSQVQANSILLSKDIGHSGLAMLWRRMFSEGTLHIALYIVSFETTLHAK